jgi:hypothetical protein
MMRLRDLPLLGDPISGLFFGGLGFAILTQIPGNSFTAAAAAGIGIGIFFSSVMLGGAVLVIRSESKDVQIRNASIFSLVGPVLVLTYLVEFVVSIGSANRGHGAEKAVIVVLMTGQLLGLGSSSWTMRRRVIRWRALSLTTSLERPR